MLNPARRSHAGPLTNVTAADHFWQLLPREDPVAAQRAVSEALADLALRDHPNLDHFRALLALDQLTRSLGDALLVDYATGGALSPSLESSSWQSAFALCRSFGQAFEDALCYIREDKRPRGWREYESTVLLRLFQHRQIEFLLRPFISEHSIPDCWFELHGAYRYAESAGLLIQPLVSRRSYEARGEESTLEREYIHILLVELLNVGQLSPYDAFWLSRQIPRWRAVLSLQSDRTGAPVERADNRFVVDLDSAEGLVRPTRSPAGARRYLDPSPMLALINEEIASLCDPTLPADSTSPFRRGRQLKLLRRLSAICVPKTAPIRRRGDRLPVVSTAKAIVGLPHITRMLRHEKRRKTDSAVSAGPAVEAGANPVTGRVGADAPSDLRSGVGQKAEGTTGEFGVPHHVWQLKDCSESGCRLRGKIGNPNLVLPGALVALRERDDMPWTLAIVRRLRKRIGDRVDIGVEYIGRDPLGVALDAASDDVAPADASSDKKRRRCVALYLRESSEPPRMPFKTLIMSPSESKAGRCLSLRSGGAKYTVRLKEPIEEQDGFVWLPYEVVFRRGSDRQAQRQPDSGEPAFGPWQDPPPLAASAAASAKSAVRK